MAERLAPKPQLTLLEEALKNKNVQAEEKESVERAQKGVPELEKKSLILLGLEPPEPPVQVDEEAMSDRMREKASRLTPEILAERKGEIEAGIAYLVRGRFMPVVVNFEVPIEENNVLVTLSKGRNSNFTNGYEDNSLRIDVHDLDYILCINQGQAVMEAKARTKKPNSWYLPVPGLSISSDPIWERKMNMEDFENYNNLLDRLSEPDVVKTEIQ